MGTLPIPTTFVKDDEDTFYAITYISEINLAYIYELI